MNRSMTVCLRAFVGLIAFLGLLSAEEARATDSFGMFPEAPQVELLKG
jgi:hypothetical protein